jgi:hypothetical protein
VSEKPSRLLRVILIAIGAGGSFWLAWGGSSEQELAQRSYEGEEQLYMDPRNESVSRPGMWSNPELTTFERLFCRGNRVSEDCPEREMHPFKEYFDYSGQQFWSPAKERELVGSETFELNRKQLEQLE